MLRDKLYECIECGRTVSFPFNVDGMIRCRNCCRYSPKVAVISGSDIDVSVTEDVRRKQEISITPLHIV